MDMWLQIHSQLGDRKSQVTVYLKNTQRQSVWIWRIKRRMHHLCLTEGFTDPSLCLALPGEPRDGIAGYHPSLPTELPALARRVQGTESACQERTAIQSYTWKKGHREPQK